ncbi:HD-GYP domain-containing protein [Anaerobacillus alkaliphilus]|nr:HD domain-containing phosphohydrolase [Anaerobacillus alkaliphilus]
MKNHIGTLSIVIVGVLVSLEFILGLLNSFIIDISLLSIVIGFLISLMVIVTCYLLLKVVISKKGNLDIAALLCLLLLFYFALYDPFHNSSLGFGFLFYPIIISLFGNRTLFFRWSTIYLVSTVILVFYLYSLSTDLVSVASVLLYGLGSILLGSLMFESNKIYNESRKNLDKKKNQHHVLNLLHSFVPVIERKTQINRNEIVIMSNLIKRVMDNFPNERVDEAEAYLISLLHFVSRIKCPDYIFDKDGRLTTYEFNLVQEHCMFGKDILGDIEEFEKVKIAFLHHHEKINGKGYPHRLREGDIPIFSQVLGIVEAYLAMTNPRAYREDALTPALAISEILKEKIYDSCVVEALTLVLRLNETEKQISISSDRNANSA